MTSREGGSCASTATAGCTTWRNVAGNSLAVDVRGVAYATEWNSEEVLKITPDGRVTTLVAAPEVTRTLALAFDDRRGHLYLGDWVSGEIHRVSADGELDLVATVPGAGGSKIAWMAPPR